MRATQVDTTLSISLVAQPEGSAFANTKVRRWTQSEATFVHYPSSQRSTRMLRFYIFTMRIASTPKMEQHVPPKRHTYLTTRFHVTKLINPHLDTLLPYLPRPFNIPTG
jgi:hypothetical protein